MTDSKTPRPRLSLIVARSQNNVIGKDGDMPWRLSEDLQRFKRLTMGMPVIMGRNTWDSLPKKPLPKRPNIVVSRNPIFRAENAWLASDLSVAMAYGEAMAHHLGLQTYFVIGGAALYRAALPHAQSLYLTEVLTHLDGDTFFPAFDENEWLEGERTDHTADEKNSYPTRFRTLTRKC